MKRIERIPILMIAVGILGVSSSAILVRYSTAPSSVTAVWRLLWTVLLMTPYMFAKKPVRRELMAVPKKAFLCSALSGVLLALHFWSWFESLQHTSVASSTILVNTEVIWVALAFILFLKGKVTGKEILAILITILGSIIVAVSDRSAGGGSLYGDVLSMAAAVACGVYVLLGRYVRGSGVSTSVYTYITYFCCAAALLVIALLQGNNPFGFGLKNILLGLGLSVFPTFLGHSAFSWSLKYFSPTFISASKLCEPVFASLLAALLFAEIPAALQVLGGLIIIAGVVFYSALELKRE